MAKCLSIATLCTCNETWLIAIPNRKVFHANPFLPNSLAKMLPGILLSTITRGARKSGQNALLLIFCHANRIALYVDVCSTKDAALGGSGNEGAALV
jgi:hypothetical protein